ncbi:hypothetical protein QFZ41_002581 [Luteibacter sp. W1I16]|uniref:Druantia anti-phage system protein DruA n=1 Tax=Luteibacter sp. W1I16 TaxID=3373922 RepID=UPI003D1DC26E
MAASSIKNHKKTNKINDLSHCEAIPVKVDDEKLKRAIKAATNRVRKAVKSNDKDVLKTLHLRAKVADPLTDYENLRRLFSKLRKYFPQSARIEPSRIAPYLIPVAPDSLEEKLFKVARGYWSMPYSKGYGRRMRFLVMDAHHEALIGIIGLQSPSADLACRDQYLDVPRAQKLSVVNNTLDAYTVGATPTYAPLLAGKLVAGFLCSPRIRQEYWRTYGHRETTQLKQRIPQPLLAITTSSAFGRSSIYNRLRNAEGVLAKPLGFTQGFGSLHLEEVYPMMVQWLRQANKYVPAGFGNGPKVRWQNICNALVGLRLPMAHLSHGIKREVFLFELVNNLLDVCREGATPDPIAFDDEVWGQYWLDRWALPRVERNPEWHEFDAPGLLRCALNIRK